MDKSTPIGLIGGFALIAGAILLGSAWSTFLDPPSLIIVLGGTSAAVAVNFKMSELASFPALIKAFFTYDPPSCEGYIDQFSELARRSRRDGLLVLDSYLKDLDDDLMRLGLEQAVDGREKDAIESILGHKVERSEKEFDLLPDMLNKAGMYAPAFGMIGTLIGLIQMLQNLDDPTQIGQGMATAMITTFYGAVLANLVFLPMASKAKKQTETIKTKNDLIMEGVLMIAKGENPSTVEERLALFVDPSTEEAGGSEPPHLSKAA